MSQYDASVKSAPTYAVRPSRVLAKMRAGQVAGTIKLNLADPRVAEIAALAGFDCVWADLEHVPNTMADIEAQIRASVLHGADIMVRVQKGSYSDFIQPFESGASGIMIPHVMTADETRQIVRTTRFHPVGRRPLDGGNADGKFALVPATDYVRQANREQFTVLQIEDPEPMEQLDAIASVPGYDVLFFGPGDYSHALGCLDNLNDKRVTEARIQIAQAARRHGKFAGTVTAGLEVRQLVDEGFQFICLGADVLGLHGYFKKIVDGFRQATAGKP